MSDSLVRFHLQDYGALHFGRRRAYRFCAPADEYGLLYAALHPRGAYIETFVRDPQRNRVTKSTLRQYYLTTLHLERALRLVDLRGPGLARIGAHGGLTSGDDYDVPRRWALALHSHPEQPDGLFYRAKHDLDQECLAIFDRAESALRVGGSICLAEDEHAALLVQLLGAYGTALFDN